MRFIAKNSVQAMLKAEVKKLKDEEEQRKLRDLNKYRHTRDEDYHC
jgi:hypothetical protein